MTLFPGIRASERPALAPFQQEAVDVLLGLLERRGGALLADGAGLGKSWVAAAVAAAWEARGGETEIVVPASLIGQWQEVGSMFGIAAPIVSHDAGRASAARVAGGERLIIVDEAHRFRNPCTRRYRSLALRSRGCAVLLVTATPVCNAPADLRALLGLLVADDALSELGVPSLDEAFAAQSLEQLRAALDALTIARDAGVLPDSMRFAPATTRRIRYCAAGRNEGDLLAAMARLRFPLVRPAAVPMLRSMLWRRLESSAAALRATLERLRKLHARALECATRGVALDRVSYRAAFGDPDAQLFQDILFPELWGTDRTDRLLDASQIRRELEALEAILALVREALADDPKVTIVRRVVERYRGQAGLIFAQSRDTARAIWSALRTRHRCGIVTGSGCRDAAGAPAPMAAILKLLSRGALEAVVATDVGCEGLNLQAASYVVHADLPWSPAKLEQRLGRVGRIGQRALRVDEILIVPRSSPVVTALERKNRERARLAPQRRSWRTAVVRARAMQPAKIDAASPQYRFLEAAARAGVLTRDLVDRLSRRYRAGTELLIADALSNVIDARAVASLVRAVDGEPRRGEAGDALVAGCTVSRSKPRSTSPRRRARR